MSGGLLSTQNFSVKFNRVNWSTFVNGPSYIAMENSISFSIGANIKSGKAGELPEVCYSWEISRKRTYLVVREHKAIQWQMTIQTDASTIGWGAHCKGKSIGGNGWKKNRDTT